MANQEQLAILMQGIRVWNQWREEHGDISAELRDRHPDLSRAYLFGAVLKGANLSGASLSGAVLKGADLSDAKLNNTNLSEADLTGAYLFGADLSEADLSKADLSEANLSEANLSNAKLFDADLTKAKLYNANLKGTVLWGAQLYKAILNGADLSEANLSEANLSEANLIGANLSEATLIRAYLIRADLSGANLSGATLYESVLVETNLTRATLTRCYIYGISAWNVELEGATQYDLVITHSNEPNITVDNLKIAQFIYLLLNNQEIRDVINTITTKVVLLLGRFTPERKAVLDALKDALRKHDYLPVVFDFEKPASRDLTETVSTLAHLAHFIIADLTDPNSIPHEVATIIPQCKVPVQPLLVQGASIREYPMFRDLRLFPWVLPTFRYQDTPSLLASLKEHVIEPAERKAKELTKLKAEE